MQRIHVGVIAGVIAFAAVLGTIAATHTVSLGAAGRTTSDVTVAARAGQLDAYAASLRRALARKPPALPAVPRMPVSRPTAPAAPPAPQTVVYRRAAPIVVVKHTHHGDDGGGEHEGGDGGDG